MQETLSAHTPRHDEHARTRGDRTGERRTLGGLLVYLLFGPAFVVVLAVPELAFATAFGALTAVLIQALPRASRTVAGIRQSTERSVDRTPY